ncbi:hypothetical protein BHE74_00053988 [Ensete ventricosum]|nr:hypothetical protein BHE74_00053988 [Ensete ventricosum]
MIIMRLLRCVNPGRPASIFSSWMSGRKSFSPLAIIFTAINPLLFARNVFRFDQLGQEILQVAVPAALALAADPLASLVDTAFIGRLGLLISVLFPVLLSINRIKHLAPELIVFLKQGSPMLAPALRYLKLRSLGAPAVLLSLAMQGVFRGFKDTKTPLYATGEPILQSAQHRDVTNIILDPILMFVFHMGVGGAAIAHVISHSGVLLLARVVAVTFCVTLAASLAARHGPTSMAAFQVSLQLWLATSLLADGLAVAADLVLCFLLSLGWQLQGDPGLS